MSLAILLLTIAVSPLTTAMTQSVAAGQPLDAAQLVGRCQTLIARDDAAAALELGRRALTLAPDDVEASLCFGAAALLLRMFAEGIPALERVLSRRPGDADALYGLAHAYAAVDDPRAEAMHARLIELRPDDFDLRVNLIEYLWESGKAEAGNREMDHLLERAPDRPELRIKYAIDLLRQQQFARAATQLQRAAIDGAAPYQVNYLLGNAMWEAGEIDRAVTHFRTAAAVDPSAAAAHHDLGRLLVWSGRAQEAIPPLERAAGIRDSAAIALDLGRAYEGAGRLPAAERAYRQAIQLEPSLSPPHYALGRLLSRLGRHSEAADALRTYRRFHDEEQRRRFEEKSQQAERNLAWLELRRGEAVEALARFERLGDAPEALIGRASALARLGRHEDAVRVLERVELTSQGDPRLSYLLAREKAALARGAVKR